MGKRISAAQFSVFCALALALSLPHAVAQTVTIPFRSNGDLLFVNMFVEGRDASLILDTGARSTFLTPEAVGLSNVAGVSSLRSNAQLAKSLSRTAAIGLTVNGSTFVQPVTVVNLNELNKRLGRKCDGILGQDFLRNFRAFTIDYRNNTVAFTR